MISPDRIRRLVAQNLLTADFSHLEPPPVKDDSLSSRVNWARQRIDSLPRSTCSLLYVPDLPLGAFFQPNPNDKNYIDFAAIQRQQKRDAERTSLIRAAGVPAGWDGSPEYHFIEKNRQALPAVNVKKAINLYFSGSDGSSPETVEKFGFCNTQTIAGAPAQIRINRRDFLAG